MVPEVLKRPSVLERPPELERLPVLERPPELERPTVVELELKHILPPSFWTRIRRRSSRRHKRCSEDPRAMSTGDYVGIATGLISTGLVWISKPTDNWFSPQQHLTHCTCKTVGPKLMCDECIPIPFLVFQGWMAATFFIATMMIARLIFCHGRWPIAAFHALVVLPLFGWSVYQAIPLAFRYLVLIMDAWLFGVVLSISLCYWFARRRAPSNV
uniref:uncharacterized protein LOC105352280 n=1 Tax=Fragaria vesca subsp. vesca TaxID=101020 RepID=UPI0005CA7DEF|nr:PREDICTED: uncharacterized protein LOC105352280 [Fragaria vesca subsp. vesca]